MTMDKTFDAAEAEPRLFAKWEGAGCFRAGAGARPGAESFCIVIPPPNVTGSLHMGHALNNTLQDVMVRRKRMQGFDVLWQPGQDHAGIATQMVVERRLAAEGLPPRREMARADFVDLVWKQKDESGDTIINQLKRLGSSCDWSRNAFTLGRTDEDQMSRAVLTVFKRLYDEGLIYRGKRLVNWDPHFETAISDIEVENVEVEGHMWHFRYPLAGGRTYEYVEKDADGTVTLRETRDWISIATTRPETMLGDGAVAVHPSDERYAPIVGALCEIPVGPKEHRRLIPIITDDYPDPDFGSGAVKITGAHDFNDYAVAKRNGIPLYSLMDGKARMRSDGLSYADSAEMAGAFARAWVEQRLATEGRFQSPTDHPVPDVGDINLVPEDLRGLDRLEARRRIVEAITAEGLAVMVPAEGGAPVPQPAGGSASPAPSVDTPGAPSAPGGVNSASALTDPDRSITAAGEGAGAPTPAAAGDLVPLVEAKKIMQPFGDRSKVVIEPLLTDQWFVDAKALAGPAIAAVRDGRTRFAPENWAKTYFQWMENIEPWCISRQLWWGHQVPVWYDEDGAPYCATSEAEAQAMAPGRRLTRDPDVLDTWFSSALWPFSTLGWPDETDELKRYYPGAVLSTGFDIIFFWVARMMMMGLHVKGEVPFRTVYMHALVRDEQGRKMSKSLGNIIDPLTLVDRYGADAVRMTLTAMAAMGRDLKLDVSRVEGYRNFGTKLWNAARFAEMNGCARVEGFDPAACAQPVNRWIVGETARLKQTLDAALDAYRFNDAANAAYAHVWGVYCDWYLEFAKPLLQGEDASAKAETQGTAAWALEQILLLLHPIMPFVTEALWEQTADRDGPLALARWPDLDPAALANAQADADIGWAIAVIEGVRSVRAEMNLAPGAQLPLVVVGADVDTAARLDRVRPLVARLARLASIDLADAAPKGAVTVPAPGATLCLPLAGVVDLEAEEKRLAKALEKATKEIDGLDRKLSNAAFLAKAPDAVVAEQRARREAAAAECAKLQAALVRLSELR